VTVLRENGKQHLCILLHGLQSQPRRARAGIQVIAQVHLRELAQNVTVERRRLPIPRQHAIETRHQLHALFVVS
jgi:hypothetical protein